MQNNASKVMTEVFSKFIGQHENGGTNRAPWLDIIQMKAKKLGQPWCAIIIFWEIIPQAEILLGKKSVLVASAHVRTAARLNKTWLKPIPQPGDIGFLGKRGSEAGHLVYVKETGHDALGDFYLTIEGNTSASDGQNRDGGEVAEHRRYLGQSPMFEELGFAAPFPSFDLQGPPKHLPII